MDDQVGKEGREGGRQRLIANEFSNSFSDETGRGAGARSGNEEEEEITCSLGRSVVRSPHARTKLPAVTIIISSSATAEFDRGSIFGR